MLFHVAVVGTDVSDKPIPTSIKVTRVGELGTPLSSNRNRISQLLRLLLTANVIPSSPILVTLLKEAKYYSDTSVFTGVTRLNISEDGIIQSDRGGCKLLNSLLMEENQAVWVGSRMYHTRPSQGIRPVILEELFTQQRVRACLCFLQHRLLKPLPAKPSC
jgi:hypothetical protein